jgi:hypothetical protein
LVSATVVITLILFRFAIQGARPDYRHRVRSGMARRLERHSDNPMSRGLNDSEV